MCHNSKYLIEFGAPDSAMDAFHILVDFAPPDAPFPKTVATYWNEGAIGFDWHHKLLENRSCQVWHTHPPGRGQLFNNVVTPMSGISVACFLEAIATMSSFVMFERHGGWARAYRVIGSFVTC